jgi:hypothetical protein
VERQAPTAVDMSLGHSDDDLLNLASGYPCFEGVVENFGSNQIEMKAAQVLVNFSEVMVVELTWGLDVNAQCYLC